MAIVGNKKDLYLNEEVNEEEAKNYVKIKNCKFKLTSAKNESKAFNEFLESLFIDYLNTIEGNNFKVNDNIAIKSKDTKKKDKKCC